MRDAATVAAMCGALSGVLVAACVGEVSGPAHHDDAEAGWVALEGQALVDELRDSPIREAPATFVRVGVVWDADRPGALEISTSIDGAAWSTWSSLVVHHVEAENVASFVGEHDVVGAPARFYRLRAGAGAEPTFVRIEFLDASLSDSLEDGDTDVGDGAIFFAVGDVEVAPRSAWGAKSPRCTSSHSPYRMAIHHTYTPTVDSLSPEARLRQIQSYHQDVRGWCDIGYHFLVSRDGRLWQGRPSNRLGSHAGGSNSGNIGISVMGTHDATPITEAQLDNIARLISGLSAQYGIDINRTRIKGHREYKPTGCPGDALFGQLGTIVARARDGVSEPPPPPPTPPTPPPPPATGTVTVKGVLYAGTDTSERIGGAPVTLGAQTTTTSATGFWQFDGVDEGAFSVTASAPGFASRTLVSATYATETWSSFGLSVEAAGGDAAFQGVVYWGSSSLNRIPDASITLSGGHATTADGNGYFKITGLAAGTYTITASAPGYATRSVTRDTSDGETAWGSVKLE